MKTSIIAARLLSIFVCGAFADRAGAAEIKARVIDGAGRPVFEAIVEVKLTEKAADGKVTQVQWLKLSSDRDGLVGGIYDEKKTSTEDLWVYISKPGYESYSTGLRSEYVLKRQVGPRDVRRIARLTGEAQKSELRELLSGDYERQGREDGLEELVFLYYGELGPALRALLKTPRSA